MKVVEDHWIEWAIGRLPLPPRWTGRLKRMWKDEDKPSWKKRLIINFFKYSFLFKAVFWGFMLGHLFLKYFLPTDERGNAVDSLDFTSELSIVVITRDQPDLLENCLKSLQAADYGGDTVHISIWVLSILGLFSGYDEKSLSIANQLKWTQGKKSVEKIEQTLSNSMGLWPNAFELNSTDGNILFVHDNAVVSPSYYQWLRQAQDNYLKRPAEFRIAGIAIESTSVAANNTISEDGSASLYAYDFVPELSIFSPNLQIWKEFGFWLGAQQSMWFSHPVMPGVKDAEGLLKGGSNKNHWSLWFSEYIQKYDMYVLFPAVGETKTLATSAKNAIVETVQTALRKKKVTRELVTEKLETMHMPEELEYVSVIDDSAKVQVGSTSINETLLSGISDDMSTVVLAGLHSEDDQSVMANWLCSLAKLNEEEGFRSFVFSQRDVEASTRKEFPFLDVLIRPDMLRLNKEMCMTALTLLRKGIAVIVSDIHQVWTRLPVRTGQSMGSSFDVAVSMSSSGHARGTFTVVAPTLRSRLFMNSVCVDLARNHTMSMTDVLTVLLSSDGNEAQSIGLSVRNLVADVSSLSSILSTTSSVPVKNRLSPVVDEIEMLQDLSLEETPARPAGV